MARGRGRRGPQVTTNDTLSDLFRPEPLPQIPLNQVEDRRRESVEVSPVPKTRFGRSARIVPAPIARSRKGNIGRPYSAYNQMAFETPRDVAVCVRRKQRKEVLLAKGKGGGFHRKPRRSSWSSIHCRRK